MFKLFRTRIVPSFTLFSFFDYNEYDEIEKPVEYDTSTALGRIRTLIEKE